MYKKISALVIILAIIFSVSTVGLAACPYCGDPTTTYCSNQEYDNNNCTTYKCYTDTGGMRYWYFTEHECTSGHTYIDGDHLEEDWFHSPTYCNISNGIKCPY